MESNRCKAVFFVERIMRKETKSDYKELGSSPKMYYFTIFRPGGNDTCLFRGIVRDPKERKKLNQIIQKIYPNVEQVGFINDDPNSPKLMMAGGEFCGNATRSTAWQILKGKPGEIQINVSGVTGKLKAGVNEAEEAYSQMPIFQDPAKVSKINNDSYIVRMEGITHFVTPSPENLFELSEDGRKTQAREQMRNLGIDQDPAAGIIYVTSKDNSLLITPVVYVRDIDTLFYETACGSGTTAVGMVLAKTSGGSINTEIWQPSGLPIKIRVDYDGINFKYAEIAGPIEKLNAGVCKM